MVRPERRVHVRDPGQIQAGAIFGGAGRNFAQSVCTRLQMFHVLGDAVGHCRSLTTSLGEAMEPRFLEKQWNH